MKNNHQSKKGGWVLFTGNFRSVRDNQNDLKQGEGIDMIDCVCIWKKGLLLAHLSLLCI